MEAGHECGSSDSYLGKFSTIDECAKACYRTNGCHFFIYGYVSKKGKCYWEKIPGAPGDCVRTTATDDCKVDCQDGWERDSYDFWALNSEYRWIINQQKIQVVFFNLQFLWLGSPPDGLIAIKYSSECKSGDQSLGWKASLKECASACRDTVGCVYFIYGYGGKQGRCYWEKTKSADCPEKWEADNYDFYALGKNWMGKNHWIVMYRIIKMFIISMFI